MRTLVWTYRPWGRWTVVSTSPEQTTKLLVVEPGHELSLQRHAERSESWLVLDGRPIFTIGTEVLRSWPDTVYTVPVGEVHRISNPGPGSARILEVITGRYDENDIERLEDRYNRE